MFRPRYLKRAKLLRKGVRKFLSYKKDLLSEEDKEKIEDKLETFERAVSEKDKELVKLTAKELTSICEKTVKSPRNPIIRENLEVIFVAIIIAIGIRSYCLQPFRIPTGSMQPTLNGIICDVHDPDKDPKYSKPSLIKTAWDKFSQGRTYVDIRIPKGARIEKFQEVTKFKFFTSTRIYFENENLESIKVSVPLKNLFQEKNRGGLGLRSALNIGRSSNFSNGRMDVYWVNGNHVPIEKDFVLQGHCDTGDQVLVNKMSYHFRKPSRGEVFVFNTKGIVGIGGGMKSQHYIKRLCGVPGDELEIRQNGGPLYVNGKLATEFGIVRVSEEYDGYTITRRITGAPDRRGLNEVSLQEEQYFALGDNSDDSADSRMWGTVPEQNLLGPGLMVYWPLEHWGRIR